MNDLQVNVAELQAEAAAAAIGRAKLQESGPWQHHQTFSKHCFLAMTMMVAAKMSAAKTMVVPATTIMTTTQLRACHSRQQKKGLSSPRPRA